MKGVIHWVSAEKGVPAEFRLYERLFTVPNPGAADNFAETINPESLVKVQGYVEPSLVEAKPEFGYQFERMGYFCADNKDSSPQALDLYTAVVCLMTFSKGKQL